MMVIGLVPPVTVVNGVQCIRSSDASIPYTTPASPLNVISSLPDV
jgi:hypothetical protein